MSHQEQGARRIGHGVGGETGDDESASGGAFKNFRGDAFFGEYGGDIFRGYEFVARRVGGVYAQQALQPAERVLLNLGERRIGGGGVLRRGGNGPRWSWCGRQHKYYKDKNRKRNARARHP